MPAAKKAAAKKVAAKKKAAPKAAARELPESTESEAPEAAEGTDAIALLTADHAAVRELFDAYEDLVDDDGEPEEKLALAQNICMMLTVHATIEEEIFYPAAKEVLDEADLVNEAAVEHGSAKDLIAQIQDTDPSDEMFDAMVKVLGEYIDHHVQEEENEMFPQVQEAGLDVAAIGADLLERKEALMAEMDDAAEAEADA